MKLVIGTANFGSRYGTGSYQGQVNQDECELILYHAYCQGIRELDTALSYKGADKIIGRHANKRFKVTTKIPYISGESNKQKIKDKIIRCIEKSLENLKIPTFSNILIHDEKLLKNKDISEAYLDTLDYLKTSKLTDTIGASVYSAETINNNGIFERLDTFQVPYNPLDERFVKNGFIEKAKIYGKKIYIRSIFLRGVLLMSNTERPSYFRKWQSIFSEWDKLSPTKEAKLIQCLQSAKSVPHVEGIIVGINDHKQLLKICAAYKNVLNQNQPELFAAKHINADETLIDPRTWPREITE